MSREEELQKVISELDEQQQDLLRVARIGFEAEEFRNSNFGDYVWQRAELLERKAELAFRTVSVTDVEKLTQIQVDLKVADGIRGFITEAIKEGNHAEAEFEGGRRDDTA